MPGAFLIAVAQSALLTEAPGEAGPAAMVAELLRGSGAPAGRVEDVYWGGVRPTEALVAGLPLALVQRGGYAVQQALHSAAQAILAGDVDLALAGGTAEPEGLTTAALLASPPAVGRYNLFPQAEVVARVALSVDGPQAPVVAALEPLLRRAGVPPEELYAVAVVKCRQAASRPLLDELKGAGLKRVKAGGLPDLLATLRGGAAKKKAGRRGLLLSLDAQGTLLATVIETV